MGSQDSKVKEAIQAIKQDKVTKLQKLLARYPKVMKNAKDSSGLWLLSFAASIGKLRVVQVLISENHDFDVNCIDHFGLTPLHHAVNNNHTDIVEHLLTHEAIIDAKDPHTWSTPVISACSRGNINMTRLLLRYGADVNIPERNNFTCLHWAAAQGNRELVELLLAHGADPIARDNTGMTPIMRAKAESHTEIASLLEEHFCKSNDIKVAADSDDESQLLDSPDCNPSSDNTVQQRYCCSCWERRKNVVLLWCGHVCVCLFCSQYLKDCPICCKKIEKVHRIYIT